MTKRLLYITTRLPWPLDNGRKVTLYHYCKGLHDLCGYEIYLYSFLESGQSFRPEDKPDFIAGVEIASPVKKAEALLRVLASFGKRDEPLQTGLFYSKKNSRRIRELARKLKPDAVIVDMIRLAPYVECFDGIHCLKSLDIDDLLSRRYARQAEAAFGESLLGTYSRNAGRLTSILTRMKSVRRAVLASEAERMSRAESRYAALYDNAFFVSPADAEAFVEKSGYESVFAAGMGADVEFYSQEVQIDRAPGCVAFVGNMSSAANAASVSMISQEILPLMSHDAQLRVIGPCPAHVQEAYPDSSRVSFLGKVEDLRPYVKGCDLFLAPIAYGSGIKTKIVEAMAMGMCVVTNSIGAEGLTAENGAEIVIDDDLEMLARQTDALLDDKERRQEIGKRAQSYAMRNHRWSDLLKVFQTNGF